MSTDINGRIKKRTGLFAEAARKLLMYTGKSGINRGISYTVKNKRIRISVLRLTAFLLLYIVNLLLFLTFRSYFFLLMGAIFTALVPFSFSVAWLLAEAIEGAISFERKIVRPGEETRVVFSMTNRSFLCALRGTWLLNTGNSFYRTSNGQKLMLSIPPHGRKQFPMTVTVTELGRIVFACREFFITDLLGIFSIHTDCSMEDSLYVLPQPENPATKDMPEAYAGIAELSESPRKGNDHSEVSDIRAYVTGDRLRDIHWKLSAKHTELMVRERVSLSGSEHVLLLALPAAKEKAEKLLTEAYRQIKEMLDRHMAVSLLVWNNHLFSFERSSCGCPEELDTAFCEIFHTDLLSHHSGLLRQYMKNCYPQLSSYLCVAERDGTIQWEICVND